MAAAVRTVKMWRSESDARTLDVAKGILVGLRRCDPEQAFGEIVDVAQRHHFPPLRLAHALVETFADPALGLPDDPAFDIVRLEWGALAASVASGEPA